MGVSIYSRMPDSIRSRGVFQRFMVIHPVIDRILAAGIGVRANHQHRRLRLLKSHRATTVVSLVDRYSPLMELFPNWLIRNSQSNGRCMTQYMHVSSREEAWTLGVHRHNITCIWRCRKNSSFPRSTCILYTRRNMTTPTRRQGCGRGAHS